MTGFHSIGIPSEWGFPSGKTAKPLPPRSSFHSIGIPSEWGFDDLRPPDRASATEVSIQLVSPASGDSGHETESIWSPAMSFHSIGIPSEWGSEFCRGPMGHLSSRFPFNWYPQRVGIVSRTQTDRTLLLFPFNWYPQRVGIQWAIPGFLRRGSVSIQLVSPASGDEPTPTPEPAPESEVSIQLVSPASGDMTTRSILSLLSLACFHSIGIPSEWGWQW